MVMIEAKDSLNKIIDDFIQTEILETAEPSNSEEYTASRRRSIRPTSASEAKAMPKLSLVL